MKSKTGLKIEYLNVVNSKTGKEKIRLHYGDSMGYETFDSFQELESRTLPWIATEMKRLSERLEDLQALQKNILGIK